MDIGPNTLMLSFIIAPSGFEASRESLPQNNIATGRLMGLPIDSVFNFADSENNYFAVKELT